MSIVVDASVLVAAVVDCGAAGEWVEAILSRDFLLAPHLLPVEATNVLRHLKSGGKLNRLEAAAAAQDVAQLEIQLLPFATVCATLDRRLAKASGATCKFLLPP